jgi:hypothetical protein
MRRASFVFGVLLTLALVRPALAEQRESTLITMNRVVDKLWPKFMAQQQSPRVTVGRGLLGLGSYNPPGYFEPGWGSLPLKLVPTAALGQSLNLNPVTGRLY